ncbi:MAG: hypothetical protein AUJ01_11775 [Acidobacteria bacterium 13_1_40CM_3_65_5]|nr:MAG: hypothetical protein AUJ01_11775 [Acidobacteria bacterium 13_1_40CM_3_65_5]
MRFDLRPEDHALIEAALAFGGAHPATTDDQRAAIATLRAALRRLPDDTPEICDAEYNLMALEAEIKSLGANSFAFEVEGRGANLTGTVNPVTVRLTIGNDCGTAVITAQFSRRRKQLTQRHPLDE